MYIMYSRCIIDPPPFSLCRRDCGEKMWKEAGESEMADDQALRAISEAEARMALAAEVVKE